jgi:membrane-bound lytic murein transglycosylase F
MLVQEDRWFYYRNETGERVGFNHELIDRMGRHVAVPVEIRSFASSEAMFQALQDGQGDIMCPALALNRATSTPTGLTLRMKVSDEEDFVWVLRKDLGGAVALLHEWLRTTRSQLFVANLYAKYFAHLGLLNKFDLVMLASGNARLVYIEPCSRRLAAAMTSIPCSGGDVYQESHWDPRPRATPARGLDDADRGHGGADGVTERTDPRQSVLGGTKYFVQIRRRSTRAAARTTTTLAAYNVGRAWQDAQEIVAGGEDHTLWSNLRDAAVALRTAH